MPKVSLSPKASLKMTIRIPTKIKDILNERFQNCWFFLKTFQFIPNNTQLISCQQIS